MTGLYVHIPFCVKKCHYCNFVITGAGSKPKEDWFLELFEKEAARTRKRNAKDAREPSKGHGRNGVAQYPGATIKKVGHASIKRKDRCPDCEHGRLY